MKKDIISRNFGHYAAKYEANAKLQLRVARELVEQCGRRNGTVLDIGAGPGIIARNSAWDVVSLDLAYEMCRLAGGAAVNADAENLPFAGAAFGNVVSSLSLQWVEDLERALAEIQRVLQPGGKFAFTTFAPDSLKHLRAAFSYVDDGQHIMEFERAIRVFAMLKNNKLVGLIELCHCMEQMPRITADTSRLMKHQPGVDANSHNIFSIGSR